jgi:hypothetical protein
MGSSDLIHIVVEKTFSYFTPMITTLSRFSSAERGSLDHAQEAKDMTKKEMEKARRRTRRN